MITSQEQNEIAPALVAALRSITNPKKDAKIPGSQKRPAIDYLSFPALIDAARKALKDTGVVFLQEVLRMEGGVGVVTRLVHLSGQWIETGPLFVPASGGPQDWGSSITYARRYSLAAAIGVSADDDDDATAAQQRHEDRSQRSGPASGSAPSEATTVQPEGTGSGEDTLADAHGEGAEAAPSSPDSPPCSKCGAPTQESQSGRYRYCPSCGHTEPKGGL